MHAGPHLTVSPSAYARYYNLFGSLGTYVLWDSQAEVKPSYIGEGNILERLVEHSKTYAKPLNAYVAVIGTDSRGGVKGNAKILESVLLEAATLTRRRPPNNRKGGSTQNIHALFKRHGVIRLNLTGYNPFSHQELAEFFLREQKFVSVTFGAGANSRFGTATAFHQDA